MKKNHRSPCGASRGKTYVAIGQDLFSINSYLVDQYNYSLHHLDAPHRGTITLESYTPAAAMSYTDIQQLRGLDQPVDYGSGVEFASGLLTTFPQMPALQIGLWLNGTTGCQDIVRGALNQQLRALWDYLESCRARRIFLRVGYEFDNPSFGYYGEESDPGSLYRAAFQRVVESCQARGEKCTDKVDFVWHSWGAGVAPTPLGDVEVQKQRLGQFFPGIDYVDWVGVSLFTQFYSNSTTGDLDTVQAVLEFAEDHGGTPVMIAESTPFGGIDRLNDPWNDWFQPVLDLINAHDAIAMWSYINCDWRSQKMWAQTGFGDTRLSINRTVMSLWRRHVIENPRFSFANGAHGLLKCRPLHDEATKSSQLSFLLDSLDKSNINGYACLLLLVGGTLLATLSVQRRRTRRARKIQLRVTYGSV